MAEENDATTKMKRLEKTLKAYDMKTAKLKQQLYEETQKRTEYEERVEGVLQQHKEEREKLAQENKKLTQEKQSLKEHMKMQSQEVLSLKQKLRVSLILNTFIHTHVSLLHYPYLANQAAAEEQQEYMRMAEVTEQEVAKLKV